MEFPAQARETLLPGCHHIQMSDLHISELITKSLCFDLYVVGVLASCCVINKLALCQKIWGKTPYP